MLPSFVLVGQPPKLGVSLDPFLSLMPPGKPGGMTSDTSSSAPASLPPGWAQALPCLTWLPDGAS